MIDYLARLGYEVRNDAEGTRILFADRSVLFGKLPTHAARRAINDAMAIVVPYLAANVAKSELAIASRQIDEVAFRVTAYFISMYNNWRSFYPEHRNHPLTVGDSELRNPATFDQCYYYCEKVFGDEFRRYVAALLGLTDKEYASTEKRRQAFWNM